MTELNLVYGSAGTFGGKAAPTVSVFADRAHVRDLILEDVEAAGFCISGYGVVGDLLDEIPAMLGEVVLIDVPLVDPAVLAGLMRIDMHAARTGTLLVVSTTLSALDDVFACLDQSQAQILVAPSRAERILSLGQALVAIPRGRVRELSHDDRLTLLRLTEQVGQMAERLDRLGGSTIGGAAQDPREGSVFRFETPVSAFVGADEANSRLVRASRPPLPDPRLVRRIIRQRQLRARFFEGDLFADPAWDMLLDLTAARAEHTRVSVTSLCIASGVPPTTALRWIGQMTEAGLLERVEDETDRRRAFVALTEKASEAMARYFVDLGREASRLV